GPSDPEESRSLRQASVRTLSCELLPKGITSGPLTFGDAESGYTIAYIFRIPDPMARGKRRSYALMALAGNDSQRAFRACPLIWRVFERIANQIIRDAEKEANRLREKQNPGRAETNGSNSMKNADGKSAQGTGAGAGELAKITAATARNFDKPVTSFLTGRARTQTFYSANPGPPPASAYRRANLHSTTSPYGGDFARNAAGQIRARNLAEITGNTYIFAEMHAQFVLLLKELRRVFPSARPQRSHSGFFHQNSIAACLPSSEELGDEAAAAAADQERRARDVNPCQTQQSLAARLEISYDTKEGHCQFFSSASILSILPISVNVQDAFQNDVLISKYTVSPGMLTPIRLLNCNIPSSSSYEVQPSLPAGKVLDVFPKQPACILYKTIPRLNESITSDTRKTLALTIEFSCLDEESLVSIENKFASDLAESDFGHFARLLVPRLLHAFGSQWTAGDLEAIGLLREINVLPFEQLKWAEILEQLSTSEKEALLSWLEQWHK
ncbi:hypothetical protein KEM56_004129, partial [Ascosphaera pollenicola]